MHEHEPEARYVRAELGARAEQASAPLRATAGSLLALRSCYFLLGAGMLAGWNSLLTATDYFEAMYPGWHSDRLFTVAYLPLCLAMLLLCMRFPNMLPLRLRIRLGYAGFTAAISAVPLIDALVVAPASASSPTGVGPPGGLAAVIVCVAVVGLCDGMAQGALFAEVATAPEGVMQALVAGTASSGLLICALRIGSKASFEAGAEDARAGLRYGTRLYFLLAGVLSFSCSLVYDLVVPRIQRQLRLQHVGCSEDLSGAPSATGSAAALADARADVDCERRPLLLPLPAHMAAAAPAAPASPPHPPLELELSGTLGSGCVSSGEGSTSSQGGDARRSSSRASGSGRADGANMAWGGSGGGAGGGGRPAASQLRRCVGLCWPLCASLFAVYGLTLSVFPGFLAEDVHSADLGSWYPIVLITVFNLADFVGKSLPCLDPEPRLAPSAAPPASGDIGEARPLVAHNGAGAAHDGEPGGAQGRHGGAAAAGTLAMRPRGEPWALRLLRPLRRPQGVLAASLLRGGVALPAFLAAARWHAPAAAMALLTAALGVTNGYLTSQALTMGPSVLLQGAPHAHAHAAHVPAAKSSAPEAALAVDARRAGASGGGAAVHAVQSLTSDAEVVEGLLVICLVAGLNVGAYLGWLWLL